MFSEDKNSKFSLTKLSKKLLSSDLEWSEWMNEISSYASASFPIMWDSVEAGKNDIVNSYTNLPVFETVIKVGRMAGGDHSSGTAAEQALDIQPSASGQFSIMYTHFDADWYYTSIRDAAFHGKVGEMSFTNKYRVVESNKIQHAKERRLLFLSLEQSIDDTLLKQMKISAAVYKKLKDEKDCVGFIKLAYETHGGQGDHVGLMLILKLVRMNIAGYGQDFSTYCKEYNQLNVRIMEIAAADFPKFVNMFLNAMFVVGLKSSDDAIITDYVNKLFQSPSSFPVTDVMQSQIFLMMKSNEKLNEAVSGVISSNFVKKSNSLNKVPGRGKPNEPNIVPLCWNCNELGHKNYQCKKKKSICDVCNATHHTLCHDAYMLTIAAQQKNKCSEGLSTP